MKEGIEFIELIAFGFLIITFYALILKFIFWLVKINKNNVV